MDAERWQRVRALFGAALEREPEERNAWLEGACGGDLGLRDEVRSLLAAQRAGDSLLPEPPPADASPEDPLLGQRLGPYEVQQRLGGGGMGNVYLAARVDGEFKKRVALKVLKPGMDSEDVLRRFRTERQILAALNHPNIARLLDGGTTDRGLPFLVMEYVEGRPITEHCAGERLSLSARLELFRTVCSAVQFAHQNLVVHRDLKPANILVDSEGTPKLLDFGIAKLLNPELMEQTRALTRLGVQPLTLDYASPEQIRGGHVTTASDVYSLGVLLYELLTGKHPYRDDGCTMEEMVHRITEVEPEPPSSAAATAAAGTSGRGSQKKLAKSLAGDLDSVVLTALAKEPRRRYGSAENLAEDIRRFREGLPVLARKPTLTYRLGKFARRHRLGVAVAATAVLALVLFGAGMGALAWRLARERERAEQEGRRAEQVTAFLTEVFKVSDPSRATGETVSARELLDAAAQRIGTDLADQPEVQADLMETIGMIYRGLGLTDRALPLVEAALARRRQLFGDDHLEVAQSFNDLALLHEDRGEYKLAEANYRRALDVRRRRLGPLHADVAQSTSDLAVAHWYQGDYEAAEKGFRQSLATRRKLFGDHHLDVAKSLTNLGLVLWARGRYAAAERPLREALALRRSLLGEVHVDVADAMSNLALPIQAQGRYVEAERLQRGVLEIRRKLLDPDHPRIADALNNMGFLLLALGRYAEADGALDEALAIRRRRLGDFHPDVAQTLELLGEVAQGMDDFPRAEANHREALAIRRQVFGEEHRTVADSLGELAAALQSQGQLDSAESLLRQSLAIRRKVLGPEHPETAASLSALALLLATKGDLAAAEELARQAVGLLASQYPQGSWQMAQAESVLGVCLARRGRFAEAEPLLTKSYATLRSTFGDKSQLTREARQRLLDFQRLVALSPAGWAAGRERGQG